MKHILCFGDSNTYGLIPKINTRYSWEQRWTGILNEKLGLNEYRIIENGLCGRTTIFDDPLRENRNGSKILPAVLESNIGADVIILMLGTNDCKTVYGATAEIIGRGIEKLINIIKQYSVTSKILLVSPIHFGEKVWHNEFDPEFSTNSISVNKGLSKVYEKVANKENIYYLDASIYAQPSVDDQEHLNIEGHKAIADAIYNKLIKDII